MPVSSILLRIKNLASWKKLEWQIALGSPPITGETGAGKSIIIGALQLLLGERADKIAHPHRRRHLHSGKRFSRQRITEAGTRS